MRCDWGEMVALQRKRTPMKLQSPCSSNVLHWSGGGGRLSKRSLSLRREKQTLFFPLYLVQNHLAKRLSKLCSHIMKTSCAATPSQSRPLRFTHDCGLNTITPVTLWDAFHSRFHAYIEWVYSLPGVRRNKQNGHNSTSPSVWESLWSKNLLPFLEQTYWIIEQIPVAKCSKFCFHMWQDETR